MVSVDVKHHVYLVVVVIWLWWWSTEHHLGNGENRASFLALHWNPRSYCSPILTRIGVIAKVLPVLTASVPTVRILCVGNSSQSKKFWLD